MGKTLIGIFLKDVADEEYMKVRGFKPAVNGEAKGWMAAGPVLLPCPQHKENRCSIYETRPQSCRDWPVSPEQVTGTPCSYWFEDTEGVEKPVGGGVAPFPTL
mgnify:CR=1 FL=1